VNLYTDKKQILFILTEKQSSQSEYLVTGSSWENQPVLAAHKWRVVRVLKLMNKIKIGYYYTYASQAALES